MTTQIDQAIGYSQRWTEFISTGGFPFTPCQIVSAENIETQLLSCASEQFTGCLEIEASQQQHWTLYFSQGFICGGCGIHPRRSWLRQLERYCSQLYQDRTADHVSEFSYNYDSLAELVIRGNLQSSQMKEIIENYTIEILFDLIQKLEQTDHTGLRLSYSQIPQDIMNSAVVTVDVDHLWRQSLKVWRSWQRANLANISPNLAPKVIQYEELKQHFSPMLYDNLSGLAGVNETFKSLKSTTDLCTYTDFLDAMNGEQTLRDLSVTLKRNLVLLVEPIIPYIHQGLIELVEVDDVSSNAISIRQQQKENLSSETSATPKESKQTEPLVACIEDSSVDLLLMNHILNQLGYQFINIEDQEKILSLLISYKPDLILLDLIMPIANGYEICSQIRRIPFFKSTPVIIVTGKDGIVDRTRAKIVGASDFINKPINTDKIQQVLQNYLPKPKINSFQSQSIVKDLLTK